MIHFFFDNFNTYWSISSPFPLFFIAFASSFVLMAVFSFFFIYKSKQIFSAKSRPLTPDTHKVKDNIPTMGGVCILASVIIGTMAMGLYSATTLIILVGTVFSGLIGGLDDWGKITKNCGISARLKFLLQVFAATITMIALLYNGLDSSIYIPFINITINSWIIYLIWSVFIVVGTSNAVNLTDGLDGLATSCLIPNYIVLGIIAFVLGSYDLVLLVSLLVGSCLGFLWYNAHPAQLFMGDVGSLSLGTVLALLALVAKNELLLPITGIIFVAETSSVILQIWSYKCRKKRLFKMAPIHHHFELCGWKETKITSRFVIVTIIMCLLALGVNL